MDACRNAERANPRDTRGSWLQDTLGWTYFFRGEYEKAIEYYRSGIASGRKYGVYNDWVERMYSRLEEIQRQSLFSECPRTVFSDSCSDDSDCGPCEHGLAPFSDANSRRMGGVTAMRKLDHERAVRTRRASRPINGETAQIAGSQGNQDVCICRCGSYSHECSQKQRHQHR